jgi:Ca2+-binding EF-hand superfamily protein
MNQNEIFSIDKTICDTCKSRYNETKVKDIYKSESVIDNEKYICLFSIKTSNALCRKSKTSEPKDFFKIFNYDKNEFLTRGEFLNVLYELGEDITLIDDMKIADKNNDNVISINEFEKYL